MDQHSTLVFYLQDNPDEQNSWLDPDEDLMVDEGPVFEVDPDFIDATILGTEYNPVAGIDKVDKEAEEKRAERAREYWRVFNVRKSLNVNTRSDRALKKFRQNYDIGDTVWFDDNETFGTLKVKTDEVLVFEIHGRLEAFTDYQMKSRSIFESQPPHMPSKPNDFTNKELNTYKPK